MNTAANKPDTTSQIVHHKGGGTSISGPDAVNLYRVIVLKQALNLYAKTKIIMTRGATPTFLLAEASKITGKKYKRGEYTKASNDLMIWIETMKAGMPIKDENDDAEKSV